MKYGTPAPDAAPDASAFAEYRAHVLELIRATNRPDTTSEAQQAVAATLPGL